MRARRALQVGSASTARGGRVACVVLGTTAVILGCGAPRPQPPMSEGRTLRERAAANLGVLPPAAPASPSAELGRRLFFETRISIDRTVGCVTCHEPELWGSDGLARSRGVLGRDNERNAPMVFDVATQFVQHWRGDRASVEDQAQQSLLGPASFGLGSAEDAARRMAAIPGLDEAFRRTFPRDPQPVSAARFGEAIGAYLRTLRAPGPFDAFLAGDDRALSASARRGLTLFLDRGCASCHDGPLAGGTSFKKFGVHASYAEATGSKVVDLGREAVTHAAADRYVFKVPPLRQVARTAPYFHDGSVAELGDAVRIMATVQLGEQLTPDQVADLVAFLGSLTGEVPRTFSP